MCLGGKTRKEALANIKDAVDGYIISMKKHHEPDTLNAVIRAIKTGGRRNALRDLKELEVHP